MGHYPDDGLHQFRHVPAEDQQHEIDEKDAGAAATDHRYQRQIQKRWDARSAQAGTESGSDGAVPEAWRESSGGMHADGAADAVSICVLQSVLHRHRDAWGELALGYGPVPARDDSDPPSSHRHDRDAVHPAEHD